MKVRLHSANIADLTSGFERSGRRRKSGGAHSFPRPFWDFFGDKSYANFRDSKILVPDYPYT